MTPEPPRVSMARPMVGDDEIDAVVEVLRSGGLVQGPVVAAFEEEFADLVSGRACVAVNSGTSALHLALLSIGIQQGDEVVVPSFTFAATANAVRLVGATPVFADIDPETFCLDPDAASAVITSRTAAIMPVHLYGHPAPMAELTELAAKHHLALVEDAAQAHAAELDGRPVGSFGVAAAFSFYPTKNMTTGEGGMIAFADDAAVRRARLLRNQGMDRQYENETVGFNLRMTDIAAAMGRVQLRRLGDLTAARRAAARRLTASLAGMTRLTSPVERPGARHVFHQYTVRSVERDALQAHLDADGIDARVYYRTPVHRLPSFAIEVPLKVTDEAARSVLSLPVGPHLSDDDLHRIEDSLGRWEDEA